MDFASNRRRHNWDAVFELFAPRGSHHGVEVRLGLADLLGAAVLGSNSPQWGLDSRHPTCMYPVPDPDPLVFRECGRDATRRSHSISRASSLKALCYGTSEANQNVYRPFPNVTDWAESMSKPGSFAGSALPSELNTIDPQPIGTDQASTGNFACDFHDGSMYFGKADAFKFRDHQSARVIHEGQPLVKFNDIDDVLFMLLARTFFWQSAVVRGVRSALSFFEAVFAGRCTGCRQRFLATRVIKESKRFNEQDRRDVAKWLALCDGDGCLLAGNTVWQDTVLRVATVAFSSRARDYSAYALLFRQRMLNAGEFQLTHHIVPFKPVLPFASAEVNFLPRVSTRGHLGEVPALFVHIFCSQNHGVALFSHPSQFLKRLQPIIDEKAGKFQRGRHGVYVEILSTSFNAYVARDAYDAPENAQLRQKIQSAIVADFVDQMAGGLATAAKTFTDRR